MLFFHVRRFHHVSRKIWISSRVSPCQTHHIHLETKQPLYHQRFRIVLPFHSPGLAPIMDHYGQASHIDEYGNYAYEQRFKRTFGFYNDRAAVQANRFDHWYHIISNGSSAYESVWQWCGNYQSNLCPVRDFNGHYYHIDLQGSCISGPHSYVGDFREGSAVVRSSADGLFRAIDEKGYLLHRSITKHAFLDLDVYHKGLARVRDEHGWFYIDRNGNDIGQGRRYRQIENFYNGQALVQLLNDGSRCVINEKHQIVTRLSSCDRENRADLEQISRAYWPSFALKMGLDQEPSLLEQNQNENPRREQLRKVWLDLGLLTLDEHQQKYVITDKGRLVFDTNSITRDRLQYWLQDRYISAWLGKRTSMDQDIFADMANQPHLVALTHRVLNSYATEDWQGITNVLPEELLRSSIIVDLGGGLGSLLEEISKFVSERQRLICLDRPEVIALNPFSSRIEFQNADLFSGPLPLANYYLLSRVLHDWSDEKAKVILQRIPSQSLCIIDREVDCTINRHSLLSLHMHLLQGAQERTRDQWDHLFADSGWSVHSRTPFSGHTIMILKQQHKCLSSSSSSSLSSSQAVRKVVLPVAGLGTRMSPQSTILPKVLLPIIQTKDVDRWICRPALDLLLEEIFAQETGIEELICIINPDQYQRFHTYFSKSTLNKIRFILQPEPKGFGHAILLAESHLHNEPFVVMLGDHLYRSSDGKSSCLQQLLDTYRKQDFHRSKIGLTGVVTCTEEEISQTGLLQSTKHIENTNTFEISDMIEKPSIDVAKQKFQSIGCPNRYLCQAGIDILPPTIFTHLREEEKQRNSCVELGLREAMNHLRQHGKLRGYLLDGQRYDIGNPKEYYRTLNAFIHPSITTDSENHSSTHPSIRSLLKRDDRIRQFFSTSSEPIFAASTSGRLDVMGGFADYSGSHVLQYPIAQRTYALVQKSITDQIRMMSIQKEDFQTDHRSLIWKRELPISLLHDHSHSQSLRQRLNQWYHDSIIPDEPQNWPSYIMGIISYLMKRKNLIDIQSGLNIVIVSDLPCNKGLASSAALEVSVARAVSTCLQLDENLSLTELALLCQKVENEVVGSPCGFMDQMTCVHARRDHLFSLLCQQIPRPPFHHIRFPSNLQLFGIDSGVKRSTSSIAYQRVRQAALLGQQMMNLSNGIDHLCQMSLSTFNQKYRSLLPEISGDYPIRAATSHPIEENLRVQLFETLLSTNIDYLGELMFQSDVGYRSCGLHHEETSLLIDLLRQESSKSNMLIGAKITGGGGGGTVAVLAHRSSRTVELIKQIVHRYETLTRRQTRLFSGSSSGLCIHSNMNAVE